MRQLKFLLLAGFIFLFACATAPYDRFEDEEDISASSGSKASYQPGYQINKGNSAPAAQPPTAPLTGAKTNMVNPEDMQQQMMQQMKQNMMKMNMSEMTGMAGQGKFGGGGMSGNMNMPVGNGMPGGVNIPTGGGIPPGAATSGGIGVSTGSEMPSAAIAPSEVSVPESKIPRAVGISPDVQMPESKILSETSMTDETSMPESKIPAAVSISPDVEMPENKTLSETSMTGEIGMPKNKMPVNRMPAGMGMPSGGMPDVPDRGPKGSIMREDGKVGILGGGPPKF